MLGDFMVTKLEGKLLDWKITPWTMDGSGTWKEQPVIIVESRIPFFADHPNAYIQYLEEIHDDKTVMRGQFYTFIGQLKDGLEQRWATQKEEEK